MSRMIVQKNSNLTDIIDNNPIGKRQYLILILCGVLMILDGFDVQSMSYVAPAILQDWNIDKSQLGSVFGSGLFGLLIGSLIFSYFSDKWGRRPIILISTLFFAVCMLATTLVKNLEQLIVIRFITGLGLGAIMPNAMALCGEITPKKQRISMMMLISCGFTVGAMLGGFISAYLIPHFGWQSVFVFGGIAPLFVFLLMFMYVPESLQFMAIKDSNSPRLKKYLTEFYPNQILPDQIIAEKRQNSMPVKALFEQQRYQFTLIIWVISIMNMISLYFLSSWIPTLAKLVGVPLTHALLLGATLQLGGTLGTIIMGMKIDKIGFFKVLCACFVLATIFIILLGNSTHNMMMFFIATFLVGFTIIGGQPAINAMSANYYPTEFRTTGVGWSLGIGRIGSVIGPVVGGWLMSIQGLTTEQVFYFVSIPSLIIIAMLLLQKSLKLKT